MAEIPVTQMTLIGRLSNPTDDGAWDEFVTRYGAVLRRWCRKWGLQEADAEDVIQNIFVELSGQIERYRPSGRFRSWLKTIARRAWYDYTMKRARIDQASGDSDVLRLLNSIEAQDDFLAELDAEAEAEIVSVAMERVRERLGEKTWAAFHMLTLEKLRGEEVSERLGIQVGSVYVANSKVKKLLQEEVDRLNAHDEIVDEEP